MRILDLPAGSFESRVANRCGRISPRFALARLDTVALLLWLAWSGAAGPAVASDRPARGMVHLSDDSYVAGNLEASVGTQILRWRSPLFDRPLEFPLSSVRQMTFTAPAVQPKPSGEFCFELAGGDVIFGDLLSISAQEAVVDAGRLGHLHLRRDRLHRISPWHGADVLFTGPRGLTGWRDTAASVRWRDEGGQISSAVAGASLYGDFSIPAKSVIEIELSWKQKPDFMLALGASETGGSDRNIFRFEVWDDDLVAVGETERESDVAYVQQLGPGEGSIHLQAFLDQPARLLHLFSRGGKLLSTLSLRSKNHDVRPGLFLVNRSGDIRLEFLRISRWNVTPPNLNSASYARLARTDGRVVPGQLAGYDLQTKQFTVREGSKETVVRSADVADVYLSPPSAGRVRTDGIDDRFLSVVFHDGSRFSGKLADVQEAQVSLVCPAISETLNLPLVDVRTIIPLLDSQSPTISVAGGRAGRLEAAGVSLNGWLETGKEQPDASCLVWHPRSALNAAALRYGVSGRIVYREPPPPPMPVAVAAQPIMNFARQQRGGVGQAVKEPADGVHATGKTRLLHLRSGDTIPCDVTAIDEKGLSFKTSISDATFVPHEKIKGVELIPTYMGPHLNRTKRDRLLTLPRMQKDSPPTHLICSKNGDFLRGRVLDMDDKTLHVEVRLETRVIPRDRVAQIIWLHADEFAPAKAPVTVSDAPPKMRVQAMHNSGDRMTFVATSVERNIISGVSDVLGTCRSNASEFDQLLLGDAIDQSAAKLAYQRWKLHNAPEPKFVQANAAAAAAAGAVIGTESPLCGQPAFPFKLEMLDGKTFKLADYKNRIVIVDFWATWCGPCMQTLPLVEEIGREFADKGIELVAVNMEEQPDQIKSMLERHKLKLTVVLDRDGAVAAKYNVTAIPQTVLVDRDGKVHRLFVGGGKATADALKQAIQGLIAEKPEPPAVPQ